MPLSAPAAREGIHERRIECKGYRRGDGLWDIEGHLTDRKTYNFVNAWRGEVKAGEAVHEMWLRLTIDDDLTIRVAEAATEAAPYRVCSGAAPLFRQLEGLRIRAGFKREVHKRLGGNCGCTHLIELAGRLATVALQTIVPLRDREKAGIRADIHPSLLDSCHALRRDGEVVHEFWPNHYTGA